MDEKRRKRSRFLCPGADLLRLDGAALAIRIELFANDLVHLRDGVNTDGVVALCRNAQSGRLRMDLLHVRRQSFGVTTPDGVFTPVRRPDEGWRLPWSLQVELLF